MQIRALRCQTHAFAKRRANRPFRFFPPSASTQNCLCVSWIKAALQTRRRIQASTGRWSWKKGVRWPWRICMLLMLLQFRCFGCCAFGTYWSLCTVCIFFAFFCILLHSSEQCENIQCLHKLYKSTWNMPHNMCLVCSRKLPFDPEERGT